MDSHSYISNEIGEQVQDLKSKIQQWCNNVSEMLDNGLEKLNERISEDISIIKDSSIRIDGLEKRIRDSYELSEIKKVVEDEQEEYKRCFLLNTNNMSEKVNRLENQLKEDKKKLELERINYENDLRIAKQQSIEREKSCRIYSENLGLFIGKVNGNSRFTFIYIDKNNPNTEFYFDLFYNEKNQMYNGVECNPFVKDFHSNLELLNSRSIIFRQFICNMRKAFKNELYK